MSILEVTDAFCFICRGVLIEPVTLPCYHVFCFTCFEQSMHETSHCCPLCRKRISNWIRNVKKSNKLIDFKLWEKIKEQFKEQVCLKLNGEDDGLDQIIQEKYKVHKSIPKSGEVAQEFLKILASFRQERQQIIEAEELASKKLIEKLKLEEEEKLQNIEKEKLLNIKQDEKLARIIQEEIMKEIAKPDESKKTVINTRHKSLSQGPMDKFINTSSLTLNKNQDCLNKPWNNAETESKIDSPNSSPNSIDSFRMEMNLFKPIKKVLRTPPKRYPDGRISEINLKKVTPMKMVLGELKHDAERKGLTKSKKIHSDCSAFVNATLLSQQLNSEVLEDENQIESVPKRLKFSPNSSDEGILKDITLEGNSEIKSTCFFMQDDSIKKNSSKEFQDNSLFSIPLIQCSSKNSTDGENDIFETQDYLNPSPTMEKKLIEEQKHIEKIILQEKKDRELAIKLSQEWAREMEPQRKPLTRSMKAGKVQNKSSSLKKIESNQTTLMESMILSSKKIQ